MNAMWLKEMWKYARESAALFGGKPKDYIGATMKMFARDINKSEEELMETIAQKALERNENYIDSRIRETDEEFTEMDLLFSRVNEYIRTLSTFDEWGQYKKRIVVNLIRSLDPHNEEMMERIKNDYTTLTEQIHNLIFESSQAFDDNGKHNHGAWFSIYRTIMNRAPGRTEYLLFE